MPTTERQRATKAFETPSRQVTDLAGWWDEPRQMAAGYEVPGCSWRASKKDLAEAYFSYLVPTMQIYSTKQWDLPSSGLDTQAASTMYGLMDARIDQLEQRTDRAFNSLASEVARLSYQVASLSADQETPAQQVSAPPDSCLADLQARDPHFESREWAGCFDRASEAQVVSAAVLASASAALASKSALVRAAAARAIGNSGSPDAKSVIEAALKREDNRYATSMMRAALRSADL